MTEAVHKSHHLAFLDGLRAVAAAYVLLHHAMLAMPAAEEAPVAALLGALFRYGHYAVDVFIVLSGYCLMLPVLRSQKPLHLGTFLLRRTLRIVPTYYLAMLVSLLLIATLIGTRTGNNWDASLPVTLWDVVSHVLLIHDWDTDTYATINYAFWSIGVEWKIYFLFPLMLGWRARLGSLRVAVIATLVSYAVWLILWRYWLLNPSPWGSSPYYVGLFAMGVCAADLGERTNTNPGRSRLLFWLSGAAVGVCSWFIANLKDDRVATIVSSGFVGAWAALLLYRLRIEQAPRWLDRTLSTPVAVWTGQRGYSIYLLHAPIIQVLWVYVIEPSPWLGAFRAPVMLTLSLLLTVLCAHLFHRVAEGPFQRLSRRVGARGA